MLNIRGSVKGVMANHYGIIILAFLLTILIFAPLLVFPAVVKNEYRGININHFDADAHFYLARGKEILDGNNLGGFLLREGKNEHDPFFSYSERILLAPIKFLGLAQKADIVSIYNAYNFIGVFFLILLICFFVWQLSGSKLLSMASALFVVGGYSIVYNKALFYSDFNIYARLIYPYFSSVIFFLYLNLLLKSLKSPELKYKISAGLTFGLLFYIYFFAWSFALAFNAIFFLVFIFKKDFLIARKILYISLAGLALGLYNLIETFLFMGSAIGKQAAYFNRMSYGRGPIFSLIGFIVLIIFAVYCYKRRDDKNQPFLLALILTGWAALNQQVISGKMLQYGHYYWYFIVPLSIIAGFYMVWQSIKNAKLKNLIFLSLIFIVFINAAGGQYRSFFTTIEIKKYEQNFRPLIDILNSGKNPSVILTGDEISGYLFTIYTPHDLFWHSAASIGSVPIQRFKDALFIYFYLNKESRNDFAGYLARAADNKTGGIPSFYQNLYRNLEGYWSGLSYYDYNDKIKTDGIALNQKRPELIDRLNREYDETILKNDGANKLLKKYGVNYIVWDKNKFPEWDLSGIGDLKLMAESHGILLYQLN